MYIYQAKQMPTLKKALYAVPETLYAKMYTNFSKLSEQYKIDIGYTKISKDIRNLLLEYLNGRKSVIITLILPNISPTTYYIRVKPYNFYFMNKEDFNREKYRITLKIDENLNFIEDDEEIITSKCCICLDNTKIYTSCNTCSDGHICTGCYDYLNSSQCPLCRTGLV